MWNTLSNSLKLMVIMVLVVLGLSFAGVMACDDNNKSSLATKNDLGTLATKNDLGTLATKEDLKNLATKDDILTTCGKTKDATPVAQPNPPKVNQPPATNDQPKAPARPASRASKPKKATTTAAAPATDSGLAQRVSNLETRMARQEYLTQPLSEYSDKHKEQYLARARARLEALDRLPDKVQGESK